MMNNPRDVTFTCGDWTYVGEGYPDFERVMYCHQAYFKDARYPFDYHPCHIPTPEVFAAWLKSGRPPRFGIGPLTERQVLWLAEQTPHYHLTAPREDVPWLRAGRLLPLDIPEDWKPT